MLSFKELYSGYSKQRDRDHESIIESGILCLDPGETTGWAYFVGTDLIDCGQVDSPVNSYNAYLCLLQSWYYHKGYRTMIIEDYRVYANKVQQHTHSDLWVPKLIGAACGSAIRNDVNIVTQMAAQAKGFCSNDKLKAWGFYTPGKRHAMDAIRHGAHWLLFSDKTKYLNR